MKYVIYHDIYHDSYPGEFLPFRITFKCHSAMCREIFGHSPSPQIPGTCDIQVYCYCRDLSLGDKCTYFTDQVIHPKKYHVRSFHRYFSACIINVTSLNVKLNLTLRRHINQNQVLQVAQTGQRESVQRKRKSARASFFVYLVFIVCYLPHVCSLFIITAISEPRIDAQHLQFYTITLSFLNSTLNPLIYCWKMKQMRNTIMNKLRVLRDSW